LRTRYWLKKSCKKSANLAKLQRRNMALLEIDRELCIGCGACVDACAFDALRLDEQEIAVVNDNCTACGACIDECPVEALRLPGAEQPLVATEDLADYQGVWFWVEQFNGQAGSISWEMAGKARQLADQLGTTVTACLLGHDVEAIAQEAIAYGADRVFLVDDPTLVRYRTDPYAAVMVDLARRYKPEIWIMGASSRGRDLAGSVATQLITGLTADCTALDIDPETRLLRQTHHSLSQPSPADGNRPPPRLRGAAKGHLAPGPDRPP
jgi:electron transfer flavoprotein alpha subunit